jgi:hypothetical protein
MTDNLPPGDNGSGEGGAPPQPWFPPSGEPGGYGQPPPFDPGQQPPGEYGQPVYRPGQRPYAPWPGRPPAQRPGVIPLRPLGVGEILDGAFTSIRRNPRATLGIAALLLTASAVITTTVSLILVHHLGSVTLPSPGQKLTTTQASRILEVLAPTAAVAIVLAFIVDTVLTGLLTVVIARSVLGLKITAGEAWRVARPRMPALIGVTLLIPLIVLGLWAVYAIMLIILAVAHAPGALIGGLAAAGAIAAIVFTIWFTIMFRMAGQAVVLELEGPARALARSWRLVRGSFWRVLGITLLAGLIVEVTKGVLQLPFGLLAVVAGGGGTLLAGTGGNVAGILISAVGGVLAGAVARPISAGVAALLYLDLRMRREGLDLILQTAVADGSTPTGDEFASLWRPGARTAAGQGVPPGPGVPPAGGPPAW